MKKIFDLSVYGTAIRTENWLKLYDNIVDNNNIKIEIVLCGSVEPKFKLPNNFKFIYSNVKPSQCSAIALLGTSSNLVSLIGDDCVYSKSYFDKLFEFHISNENYIVGGQFMRNKNLYNIKDYMLHNDIPDSPLFSMSPILDKEEIFEVGGIDKNFIAIMWHEDLIMRLITLKKKKTKIYEGAICKELTISDFNIFQRSYKRLKRRILKNHISDGPNLFQNFGIKHDLPYLKSCWVDKIENSNLENILAKNATHYISNKRLKKVNSFDQKNLLNMTQGIKGKW